MRIGLLSDTHGFLDEAVFQYFGECDEIWHAGDFGSADVFDRLAEFRPVRGVYGNIDGVELRAALPADAEWDCEGLRVYMTHIGGYPERYDPRAKRELITRKPGLFVCGHSHLVRVVRDPRFGLMHMNPGAAGHVGWHQTRTLIRFTAERGEVKNVELIELGPRGKKREAAG